MHWVLFVIAFLFGGFIGMVIMALLVLARREEDKAAKYFASFIDKGNSERS